MDGVGDGDERAPGRRSSTAKYDEAKRGEGKWVVEFRWVKDGAHGAPLYRGGGGRRREIGGAGPSAMMTRSVVSARYGEGKYRERARRD